MNKQELIKTLEELKNNIPNIEGTDVHDDYLLGKKTVYVNAIGLAKQLDEPQKPVVPECFDIDYKKYEYLKNNKSEILMTAIGGIHRVSFPGSFKDLPPFPLKTGIKWNKWTRETILWASRNYADFCQAVITGDYEVEKEPLYYVKLPFEVWDEEAAELKTEFRYLGYDLTSDETRMCPTKEPWKDFSTKLDEITIKSADERYWPFAVPVEQEEVE